MYRVRRAIEEIRLIRNLPARARHEYFKDNLGILESDPGPDVAIDRGVAWLGLAQDESASRDGGVAEFYSLINGWGASYPETTGYIIPTLIAHAQRTGDPTVLDRARRMLDWLVSIQFPDGSFQGGNVNARPRCPTVFNTGQILLGLASGVREFGDAYRQAMRKAADWLVRTQEPDGCWRKFISPFVVPGPKTYHTHVAWGLLEAARIDPNQNYAEAALANVRWALTSQTPNGWFGYCDLNDTDRPLTHTLGYALRGVIEAHIYSQEPDLLEASRLTADHLFQVMKPDGYVPGRLFSNWRAAEQWACLTGTVQLAHCWLLLYQLTGDKRFRRAGYAANRYVRLRTRVTGREEQCGGVKGAFPVNGSYHAYNYINWACKFFVDSNVLEQQIRAQDGT
jgi:hypothetical protein